MISIAVRRELAFMWVGVQLKERIEAHGYSPVNVTLIVGQWSLPRECPMSHVCEWRHQLETFFQNLFSRVDQHLRRTDHCRGFPR